MNFCVGDRVRIKEDLQGHEIYDGLYFHPNMERFRGKEYKIINITPRGYYVLKDYEEWHWNDAMLEPIDSIDVSDVPQYSLNEILDLFGL